MPLPQRLPAKNAELLDLEVAEPVMETVLLLMELCAEKETEETGVDVTASRTAA